MTSWIIVKPLRFTAPIVCVCVCVCVWSSLQSFHIPPRIKFSCSPSLQNRKSTVSMLPLPFLVNAKKEPRRAQNGCPLRGYISLSVLHMQDIDISLQPGGRLVGACRGHESADMRQCRCLAPPGVPTGPSRGIVLCGCSTRDMERISLIRVLSGIWRRRKRVSMPPAGFEPAWLSMVEPGD